MDPSPTSVTPTSAVEELANTHSIHTWAITGTRKTDLNTKSSAQALSDRVFAREHAQSVANLDTLSKEQSKLAPEKEVPLYQRVVTWCTTTFAETFGGGSFANKDCFLATHELRGHPWPARFATSLQTRLCLPVILWDLLFLCLFL